MEGNEYQARNIDSMLLTIKRLNQGVQGDGENIIEES